MEKSTKNALGVLVVSTVGLGIVDPITLGDVVSSVVCMGGIDSIVAPFYTVCSRFREGDELATVLLAGTSAGATASIYCGIRDISKGLYKKIFGK